MKKRRLDPEDYIYIDEDYIIVNKPVGLASIGDWSQNVNLLTLVHKKFKNAQICHRLDKQTSGVIVFAQHSEAMKNIAMQFENRKVEKKYHAITEGIPDFVQKKVDKPLFVKNQRAFIDYQKGSKTSNSKPSTTIFSPLEVFKQNYTLMECKPLTGRMHQIRVHLSFINMPIIGDAKYGGNPFFLSHIKKNYNIASRKKIEKPMISSPVLHAYSISFLSLNNKKLTFNASYSKKFNALKNQLTKYK